MLKYSDLGLGKGLSNSIGISILLQLFCMVSFAAYQTGQVYSGKDGTPISVEEIVDHVAPGSVVFFGEAHDQPKVKEAQLKILGQLKSKYKTLSVGMEFFSYPDQKLLTSYRLGLVSESEFLTAVNWGSFNFSNYREQVLLPSKLEAKTLALNAPRQLTNKIAKNGLESLNADEFALLPPQFTLGNDDYYVRFKMAIGDHVTDPTQLKNYFIAQSVWDDTMAWQIVEFFKSKPDRVLFVIVGDFHVQYGGGLPDRVKARSEEAGLNLKQLSISTVVLNGLDEAEQNKEILPSSDFGQRADYVWTFQF